MRSGPMCIASRRLPRWGRWPRGCDRGWSWLRSGRKGRKDRRGATSLFEQFVLVVLVLQQRLSLLRSLSSGCDLSGLSDLSASEGPSKRMSRCQTGLAGWTASG